MLLIIEAIMQVSMKATKGKNMKNEYCLIYLVLWFSEPLPAWLSQHSDESSLCLNLLHRADVLIAWRKTSLHICEDEDDVIKAKKEGKER